MKCKECMADAPYNYCCKCECGQHSFCMNCDSKSKGDKCPNES